MSTLSFEKKKIPAASFNGMSSLPPLSFIKEEKTSKDFFLDEDDGLFLHYGKVRCVYPYRWQDTYDRVLKDTDYDIAVLENEHLKATFMPALGGKLWSLYDKDAKKELLFENDVVRPCNLAVRNAWTSGGVEWNVGFKGHFPYTCSFINTARTHLDDGTPVLRFYYFERIREVVVQMDFFLPDGEKFLYTRMRITNPNDDVVPMYWWSNIAVTLDYGDRVVVPATQTYTSNKGDIIKVDIPVYDGLDLTYPARKPIAQDCFWVTEKNTRKYICQLNDKGYGLIQASTDRLKGRKLFVWGDSIGGARWQNLLTADDKSGKYSEIQCGLANTQYECLPMPPHTVWEWTEVYGAMNADPALINSEWSDARAHVEGWLDDVIPMEKLDGILKDTRAMAKRPADETVFCVDGWAALEAEMRKNTSIRLMNDHLDFGTAGEEQAAWTSLMTEGTVGEHDVNDVPASYQIREQWLELLRAAIKGKDKDNWYAHYLLGTAYIALQKFSEGEKHLLRSIALADSAWAEYALAVMCQMSGDRDSEQKYMIKAHSLLPSDVSLAKEVFRSLYENSSFEVLAATYEVACDAVKAHPRCKLYYAYALLGTGRINECEDVLCKDGNYLVVDDLREGEEILTDLWVACQKAKLGADAVIGEPPKELDYRMYARRNEWHKE